MTCDGKVMVASERDCGGIELAVGGDPGDDPDLARCWTVGVVWLGMTYETARCWRARRKRYGKAKSAAVEQMREAERRRWYP